MAVLSRRVACVYGFLFVWSTSLINNPQRGRRFLVPRATLSSSAAPMGKNKGSVPCTLCDRTFTSIADMQQVSGFLTSPRNFADFSPQHLRDKRHNTPAQVPIVEARPPVQQPQVQVQHEPVPAVRTLLLL